MKLKMIECIKCKELMPELRLIKFGYKNCVNCSTVGAYKAVSQTHGEGDHTWNDIHIMTPDQLQDYSNSQKSTKFDSYKDIDA